MVHNVIQTQSNLARYIHKMIEMHFIDNNIPLVITLWMQGTILIRVISRMRLYSIQ